MVTIQSLFGVSSTVMLAFGMLSVAGAQTTQSIFKCVDGETIAYQSMPCAGSQTEQRVMTGARAASPDAPAQPATSAPGGDSAVPVAAVRGRMWPFRRTLMLGISDDEVLNMPGWGVPKRITRERKAREWHEEWSYGSPINGERRLHFVNSTLVDVVDQGSAQQVASLTIR